MDNAKAEWLRRADDEVRRSLPPGVSLMHTLRGHVVWVGRIAWSPDGKLLASPSQDGSIRLWDTETGECSHTLRRHWNAVPSVAFDPAGVTLVSGSDDRTVALWDVTQGRALWASTGHQDSVLSVAFHPAGHVVATGSRDRTIKLWEPESGTILRSLEGHHEAVFSVAFDSAGHLLASGSYDRTIRLWEPESGRLLHILKGTQSIVMSVAFDPAGRTLVSASSDGTVRIWEPHGGKLLRTLEGHTQSVECVAVHGTALLASKGLDNSIRLWHAETGACVATIRIPGGRSGYWTPGLAFHPRLPLLAAVGSDPGIATTEFDRIIHIFALDVARLLGRAAEPSAHYVNAKVVLVGDTGVGKSGLSLVLNRQPFEATDSTPGRRVWTFDSREVPAENNVTQTRETLLWDLAGQPGYRVIHQLHLNEVAVALVVFDARSETDPLAGVRHWDRALRLARQRQAPSGVPMRKFLVSARNDRGGVSIGEERLEVTVREFGFDGYFKTSAKEGWEINELRAAIERAIAWDELPVVSSSQLFADIKSFLLDVKKTGRLLAPARLLYDEFDRRNPGTAMKVANLQDQFDTCIGRLENRDLIRRPKLRWLRATPAGAPRRLRLGDGQHGQRGARRAWIACGGDRPGWQVLRAGRTEDRGLWAGAVAVARDGGGAGPARSGAAGERGRRALPGVPFAVQSRLRRRARTEG